MTNISKARNLRKGSTVAERTLWKLLRDRRLAGWKFRRQTPIGSYIVDFVCFEKRLVIELDGGQHQGQESYDEERTNLLQSQGFRVVRFWNSQILGAPDSVQTAVLSALQSE